MDTNLLQGFIEEVESYLPTIRGGILVSGQNGGNRNSELNISLTQIQTIKNAAAMIELEEVRKVAADLEQHLRINVVSRIALNDMQTRFLLDKLAVLEEMVASYLFSMEDTNANVSDFVDESFNILQLTGQEDGTGAGESQESGEEFEIDDEMMEIFGLEAEDLLRNINANLEILEGAPNNREALLEIRRNAHTLKGSAGIVGLKKLSAVAHRVEDLLDFMSDNDIEGDDTIFEFLLSSTDCFSALASGDKSAPIENMINAIYQNFDKIMETLKAVDNLSLAGTALEETLSPSGDKDGEGQPQIAANQSRSVVRVSLEKLDDLVKIVSGLVINRSIFEQRLTELEQQIAELTNSTRRLQGSTTKLETKFEASMLDIQRPNLNLMSHTGINGGYQTPQTESPGSFDTLELDQYTEFHQTTRELVETTSDTTAINAKLDLLKSNFEMLFDSQRHLVDELQEKLLRLRMVKFGSLFSRLQRTVRVTAEEEDKLVELKIEGGNLEVDTQIIDTLIEPLLHLLRNGVAHGIEPPDTRRLLGKYEAGQILVKAYSEGTHIVLKVTDDGRGISAASIRQKAIEKGLISYQQAADLSDEDALGLVFLPGLTTAEEINQVSGRGVGLNIVKTQIERNQGEISISTEHQRGSTFTVRLPMSQAVTRSLLVKADRQTFAFPLKLVKHICEFPTEKLIKAKRDKSIQLGDTVYKVVHLSELLGLPSGFSKEKNTPLLLIDSIDKPCALMVDKILKPEETIIKPLGNPLQHVSELLGATILGDGKVVPVLDLIYLLKNKHLSPKRPDAAAQPPVKAQTSVMIVDDSPSVRHLTSRIIKNADWDPVVARDGLEALEILQNSRHLPDVILTDVEMPKMDGYELLYSLKQQEGLNHIPVVMITSRAGDKHRQKAFDLGVSEYLTKPFEDAALIGMIKRLAEV